jgi:7-keto-8-aminopelargonate synthetase and related enzymes
MSDLFDKALQPSSIGTFDRFGAERHALVMRRVDGLDSGWCQSGGRRMLMLASNNYLGLAGDQRLIEAGLQALRDWGNSTSGSRLLNGTNRLHIELEEALARFKGCEAAAVFPSGYMANLGLLSALLSRDDVMVMDRLAHASIIDGCRLAGATLRSFRHQDVDALDRILAEQDPERSVLVVLDGIYSMDGDFARLPEILAVCRRHRARIMIDDAHATGVAGANGRGTADHFGIAEPDVVTGTLSKALGVTGGFVAGPQRLIDHLKLHARSFIYSTSLSPVTTASLLKALEIAESEPERRDNLWRCTHYLRTGLQSLGFDTGPSETPIVPVILRDREEAVLDLVTALDADGIFASPVVHPACPRQTPRVRLSLNAQHRLEDMDLVLNAFARHGKRLGLLSAGSPEPIPSTAPGTAEPVVPDPG